MRERQRMPWNARGSQNRFSQFSPRIYERMNQRANCIGVFAELRCALIQGTYQHYGSAVVKRVRERCLGLNPVQTETIESQHAKKWRTDCHGMNSRANVVHESRKRQLSRTR